MRNWITTAFAVALFLGPVAHARADVAPPYYLAAPALAVVVVGGVLTYVLVVVGLRLVRGGRDADEDSPTR